MKFHFRPTYSRLFLLVVMMAAIIFGTGKLFTPNPAYAQENSQNAEEQTESDGATQDAATPQIRTLPPAYEEQMLRLAEVLGALHYLRELCGANEGQTWRQEMEKLLIAEDPSESRRAQLIAHFNRGFRGYAEIYRECTKPASEAANQFLQQGMRLAAEIPNRFGR